MASHPATTAYHQPVEPDSNVFFKVATMLLGDPGGGRRASSR